ncbi:MAG TPA: ABC transporter permease [Methanotrichaceae archaeon]|nr:ABC transporter permease [Methanotrichaceae archaeon]
MESFIPTFEFSVASRHITYRKWRTALAVGAVALAVAIAIIFVSIQNGFQEFIFDIVFKNLPHATVSPLEGEDYLHLYRTIMDRAWAIPGVIAVSPNLAATATLAYKDNAENVAMVGVVPVEAEEITRLSESMIQGDLNSVLGGNRIVMGQALADKLKVKYGDTVQASFPDASPTNLVISGIFDTGFDPVDEGITYVSLDTARSFLGEGDVISGIDIKLEDPFQADTAARQLQSYGYNAKSWQQLFPEIVRTLAFERTQNFITELLIMIIATFGIASIMNMLVQEKTREIGMLMAMGARPSQIRRLFLLESGLLGFIGAVLGCVLGLIVALQLRGVQIQSTMGETMDLPILINPWDFLFFTLLATILSIAAGTYPAYKASRLDPVEALRG